ncbi:MAG: hypothetical protein M9892_03330 [Bacteroidetes bacterium]|nr:hypothetical protein [Bacteroidota bacterium]
MNKTLLITSLVFLLSGFSAQAQSDSAKLSYYKERAATASGDKLLKYVALIEQQEPLDSQLTLRVAKDYFSRQEMLFRGSDKRRLPYWDTIWQWIDRYEERFDTTSEGYCRYKTELLKQWVYMLRLTKKCGTEDCLDTADAQTIAFWEDIYKRVYTYGETFYRKFYSTETDLCEYDKQLCDYRRLYNYIIYELK